MQILTDQVVKLRPARRGDEQILFPWRNLPWVIELGASRKPVTWDEHRAWFADTLSGERRRLFIIEIDHEAVGMLRYDDLSGGAVEVSTYLMPEYMGQGVGRKAFAQSVPQLLSWRKPCCILARVRRSNKRSLEFFKRAGFSYEEAMSDQDVLVMKRDLKVVKHSQPFVGEPEVMAAAAVIRSGHIARGPVCERVEQQWCDLTSTTSAVCVSSGLGALRLALLVLGTRAGDEVILPAYSCVALINAVLSLRATPILVDVLPDQWTISPFQVEQSISPKTRAIIAVHMFGSASDIPSLTSFGAPVIEDCAHGIGGQWRGKPFGCSGTMNVGSFYATKLIAGGGGGIVASTNSSLIASVRRARDYGDQLPSEHHLNDTMTDLEAALASEQLARLRQLLTLREDKANCYHALLSPLVERGLIHLPDTTPGRIWYRYVVRLKRHDSTDVCKWMAEHGVNVEQPVWDLRESKFWSSDFTNAAVAFDRVISLPLYPSLDSVDQQIVAHTLTLCLDSI